MMSRKFVFLLTAVLAIILLLSSFKFRYYYPYVGSGNQPPVLGDLLDPIPQPKPDPALRHLDPLNYLKGPPTASYKDNLLPNEKYITSWINAGWTNDVMTYANLIYLAHITDRIPIIGMFTPSHIGGHVRTVPFGDVFDVPRLRAALGKPVLEWREVKDPNSEHMDSLGCWNAWESLQYHEARPRWSIVPEHLKIDLSYTKMPGWIKLIQNFEHDKHVTFWTLARFAYPETRNENLVEPLKSPELGLTLPPDEHLLCYDYLYYVCAQQPMEYEHDFGPAWRYVLQHMHYTPYWEQLSDAYVRRAFGAEHSSTTPPYIIIHTRRTDFSVYCEGRPLDECYPSIAVMSRRVDEVKAELLEKKGMHVENVIMTSDESSEAWWADVEKVGWKRFKHLEWAGQVPEGTTANLPPIKGAPEALKEYVEWFPLFIDATAQSRAVGFIGTDGSTVSLIARRRVETWQNGVTRTMKWGHANSDDH